MPETFDADFKNFVAETIKEVQAGGGTSPVTATVEPLTINIAGQPYQFKDREQLEQALNQFVQTTAGTMAQLQQAAQTPQQAQQTQGSLVTGQEAPSWSDEAFIDKMTKTPKDAMEYALNQIFFDGKAENPGETFKQMFVEQEQIKRALAAYQFKEAHPEFPGGAQAAQVIEQVRSGMSLPYDVNGLEAAYLMAQNKGLLPNYIDQARAQAWQQQQAQLQNQGQLPQQQTQNPYLQQNPQFQPQQQPIDPRVFNGGLGYNPAFNSNPYLQAPPGVNRGGPGNFIQDIDPENLTIEQIEKVFEKAGRPIQK